MLCLKMFQVGEPSTPCGVCPRSGGVREWSKKFSQQRDLFESERSFRLLVEGVADYALYMLDPNGIVTSWNIGGERIKGYAPDEIVGQHFSRFYTEADRANGKPARALGDRRGNRAATRRKAGASARTARFFWASVIIDPIREDGELVGFAKITRDITERREAQLKLEADAAAARRSRRRWTRSASSPAASRTISTTC